MSEGKAKKDVLCARLVEYLEKYPRVLVVLCDNIGSKHMQKIRLQLRGKGALLMGKNTLLRYAIRQAQKPDENGVVRGRPEWLNLIPNIKQNVGLVFTDQSLEAIANIVTATKVPAAAKVGAVAPNDVMIPKGPTTLEPTKTSFFAALDIATKITKGSIELISDVALIKKGQKVGSSEAQLLQMLNINPFQYGMVTVTVYDEGCVYPAEYLAFGEADLYTRFAEGVGNVAALSLALGRATVPAFPHVLLNAYKNLLAIAVQTAYVFPEAETVKKMAENPGAFAAAAPTTAAPAKKEEAKPKVEEKKPAKKEESEEEGLGDIFGF